METPSLLALRQVLSVREAVVFLWDSLRKTKKKARMNDCLF